MLRAEQKLEKWNQQDRERERDVNAYKCRILWWFTIQNSHKFLLLSTHICWLENLELKDQTSSRSQRFYVCDSEEERSGRQPIDDESVSFSAPWQRKKQLFHVHFSTQTKWRKQQKKYAFVSSRLFCFSVFIQFNSIRLYNLIKFRIKS